MSLRTLFALVDALERNWRMEKASMAIALRMSQAEGKDFKKYLGELKDGRSD